MELVPMVYEHAAQLIDNTPWRVSRSEEWLYAAHREAYQRYRHAPVVFGIDIYNVEPEAYGAVVEQPADTGVPSITQPICASLQDICALPLFDPQTQGRMPMLLRAAQRLAAACPQADVCLPVSGPVSIAGNLMGLESLLYAMLDDDELAREALRHLVRGQRAWCREIARHGLGIIVFDSAAAPPMISPALFEEIVRPALQELMHEIAGISGAKAPLIIGGDTAAIAQSLAGLETEYLICPAETDQRAFLATMASYPEIMVRVNMRAGLVASPDITLVHQEIDRLRALVAGRRQVCLGTGIIPYGTPAERVQNALDYARNDR